MLKTGMYVRCSIDTEDANEPRDFIVGKISDVNDFAETAIVCFFDLIGLKKYYQVPEKTDFSLSKLYHCSISKGSIVEYRGEKYRVVQCEEDKNDRFYYYYYLSSDEGAVIKVCEKDFKATFNSGEISPLIQMKRFEFQNPMWYFGRSAVNKTIHTIDNAFYGFKELAGCKIFLKPYQIKTVMRCLSEPVCRYMIADEVGLGKTIEAASVLKVYLSDKKNKKCLICVPDSLKEQWKTELAFKFRIFDGENLNGNTIRILPFSHIVAASGQYDFVIVDEIHSILNNDLRYNAVLRLSQSSENVIMLSATPVQSRNEEYHKLLSLIRPDRYYGMSGEEFVALLELQNKVVRKVHSVVNYLDDYKNAIKESDNEHTEDTKEAFDELVDALEDIVNRTNDRTIEEDIEKLAYDAENFSVIKLEKIVAYICEAYQLEKCVIRNRKRAEDTNNRVLKELPYEMDTEFNNTEFRIYSLLSDWISDNKFDKNDVDNKVIPLVNAFFSSSSAFSDELKIFPFVPDEIRKLTEKWIAEDLYTIENIRRILDDPVESMSRMVTICDYLEQEVYDKKVLVFTHFKGTHDLFRKLLIQVFGEKRCAFFCAGMTSDELELNSYRFQNESGYNIMLSDESGGEGRNFQSADELICIDLPWSANTLEQRIGRLDRIGRDKSKDVVSVIVYARDSVEKDLADIWNKGLNIFNKSQSGLEIIMNDIDEQIKTALMNDFKFGLSAIVDDMIEEIRKIEKQIKEERHFDIAAYTYQMLNKEIERTVKRYNECESELFRNSMMSWASLAGFRGNKLTEDVVKFNSSSFSPRSAYNTMFVPPDMETIIEDKLNQMQNHIRGLNGDRALQKDSNSIQGTFDRALALENDYLHFFAPGDGVFDSIVNNAVSAYKGRCSAFAMEGSVDWEGFVFSWFIVPDKLLLLQKGIPLRQINQYNGFITSDIINTYVPVGEHNDADLQIFISEFKKYHKISLTDLKYCFANYGKRTPSKDFLQIRDKYSISNLEWFREKYSKTAWTELVSERYEIARRKAIDEFKKLRRIRALEETLNKEYSSVCAAYAYFGSNVDPEAKRQINEIIREAFSKPSIVLDSVCYVRVIKR